MACSAIAAMDSLRLPSFPRPFYRNESFLLSFHRPHCSTITSRPFLVVSCKFDSREKTSPEQSRRDQEQRLLSRFSDGRRKKWFRLRGRLRLMQRILRKWSPPVLLRNFVAYNRLHPKQVAFSTILGCTMALGCLFLRLTYVPAPYSVPYGTLIDYIQSGRVNSVLFEEGSRQVLFNMKPTEDTAPLDVDISSKSDIAVVGLGVKNDEESMKRTEQEMASPSEIPDPVMEVTEENMSEHLPNYMLNPNQAGADLETGTDSVLQVQGDVANTAEKQDAPSFLEVMKSNTIILRKGWRRFTEVVSSFKPIASVPEQLSKVHPQSWKYSTRRVENDEAYLLGLMREKGVIYSSAPQPLSTAFRTTLITILSLWIPLTPLFWLMYNQLSGSNMNQKWRSNSPGVNFEDVAGVDEAKIELVEIVSYLKGDMNFRRVNAKLPKGVLLVGPPGTGKTLLARAVAGEAGVPFFAASASEFVEMFVGRGAARIRDLFSSARKCSPSIIFIDELDAVGGRRGRSFNDERDQTLNQLLTEMDGFETDTGVLVIAATNRPEALDPALCRPGRFSRKVFVREPDINGRQQILSVHMRDIPINGDIRVILSTVASLTVGFVGADLANVVNEAALLAVRAGREAVTMDDLKEAINRVKFGVGNKPTFSGAVERVFDWLQQPKAVRSTTPLGYETPFWSG